MSVYSLPSYPVRFEERLWSREPGNIRSSEVTPVFLLRYAGPHNSRELTYHDCWELTHVFGGNGWLHSVGAEPLPFQAGRTYLIPPGVAHREESAAAMDTLWIGLRGENLRSVPKDKILALDAPGLAALCEQLWLLTERRLEKTGPELDGLTHAALARFLRLNAAKHQQVQAGDLFDEALAHLRNNFSAPLEISRLAARFGFSEGYYFRLFKRRTGLTPAKYLERLRLEHAMKLFRHSALNVKRVARLCGYADPLHFSRVFSRATGLSPRAFKQGPVRKIRPKNLAR